MLKKWMELKAIEKNIKEERVALEEQLFDKYKCALTKQCNTLREDGFKITIKLSNKLKVKTGVAIPADADIYTPKVDEKKLLAYKDCDWVEEVHGKPTFDIVKEGL